MADFVELSQHQHSTVHCAVGFLLHKIIHRSQLFCRLPLSVFKHFVLIQLQTHHVRCVHLHVCVHLIVSLSVTFSVKSYMRRRRRRRPNEVYPISMSIRLVFTRWLFRSCCWSYMCLMFFHFFFIFMRVYCLPVCKCKSYTKLHCVRVWHNELKKSRDQFRNRRVREKYEIYVHSVRAHTEKRENNRSDCIYIFRLLSVHFSFFVGVGFFSRTWVCGRALTEKREEKKKQFWLVFWTEFNMVHK